MLDSMFNKQISEQSNVETRILGLLFYSSIIVIGRNDRSPLRRGHGTAVYAPFRIRRKPTSVRCVMLEKEHPQGNIYRMSRTSTR